MISEIKLKRTDTTLDLSQKATVKMLASLKSDHMRADFHVQRAKEERGDWGQQNIYTAGPRYLPGVRLESHSHFQTKGLMVNQPYNHFPKLSRNLVT